MYLCVVIVAILNSLLLIFPVTLITLAASIEYFPKDLKLAFMIYGITYIFLVLTGIFGFLGGIRFLIKMLIIVLIAFAFIQLIGGLIFLAHPGWLKEKMEYCIEPFPITQNVLRNSFGYQDKLKSSPSEYKGNQESEEVIKDIQLTTDMNEETENSTSNGCTKARRYLYAYSKLFSSLAIVFSFFQIGLTIIIISFSN